LWQTSIENLESYSAYTKDVSWDRLLADPPGFRLQVFRVQGRVQSVERILIPDAQEEPRFVFRSRGVTNANKPFESISLYCPSSWTKNQTIDEPVELLGFFYGLVLPGGAADTLSSDEHSSVPLFVAKQLYWFPTEVNSELGTSASHVLLARHGVDIAGFDWVRREDRKSISSSDARVFYQVLGAVGEIDGMASDAIDHMELLRNPTSYGKQVSFRARVRKCSVVRTGVDSSLGLDRYYQLMVFPDLRDSRNEPTMVEIGKGGEKLTYRRFPFTVCCRELPEGMTPSQIENQQVLIQGFYFRFWQFDAERTRDAEVGAQISPIMLANQPIMVKSTIGDLERIFGVLLCIVIVVLLIAGWTVYRINKSKVKSRSVLPDQIEPPQLL
jgi:hypothetical protein